jgi:hypothetical protein
MLTPALFSSRKATTSLSPYQQHCIKGVKPSYRREGRREGGKEVWRGGRRKGREGRERIGGRGGGMERRGEGKRKEGIVERLYSS